MRKVLKGVLENYGTIPALLVLVLYFSWVTVDQQTPTGAGAARQLAAQLHPGDTVFLAVGDGPDGRELVATFESLAEERGIEILGRIQGQPGDARQAWEALQAEGRRPGVLVLTDTTAAWSVWERLTGADALRRIQPVSSRWPNFLKRSNLLNIANQIAVIAILAIGMTLVIITGGIDLSVGSFIALSSVVTALIIQNLMGAEQAGPWGMALGCAGGILICALLGLANGGLITLFSVPPFIVTLSMMLVASGLAYILSDSQSIHHLPDGFIWLGRGADLFNLPNAVVLMGLLYAAAHWMMARTVLGRHIYAVGGNREAARLSGVPVRRVLLIVYVICGALAGLGGVILASQLKSGTPTYGLMYELYVIAAVVVGGTSLAGGEGRILGTLLGAFLIAVIRNGMNLTGVEGETQKVVLGLVILGAVILDRLKKGGWKLAKD